MQVTPESEQNHCFFAWKGDNVRCKAALTRGWELLGNHPVLLTIVSDISRVTVVDQQLLFNST